MPVRFFFAVIAMLLFARPALGEGDFAGHAERARAAAAGGRTLEAYEALKEAELALWNSMTEISLRRTVLVTGEPSFFGAYTPRENNRYRSGEPILLYAEPVGYTIIEENGIYSCSLKADVTLLDEAGAVLGGQKDFGSWNFTSRRPVTEFMMFFTFEFTGLGEGNYIIETIIRDENSPKTVTIATPVTVVP